MGEPVKIRAIKPGHITNCPWCKTMGEKVQAVWHLTSANKQACDAHKPMLEAIRDADNDNGHRSEADYQTWMKL